MRANKPLISVTFLHLCCLKVKKNTFLLFVVFKKNTEVFA